MRPFVPAQEAYHLDLEDEDHSDSRVEATEVIGHAWNAEGGTFNTTSGRGGGPVFVLAHVFNGNDLL